MEYWDELKIPKSKELKPLQSSEVFFNTAQIEVDQYIEQELEEARRTKKNLSKNIAFSQSEKVLYELAHYSETKEIFDMYFNEVNDIRGKERGDRDSIKHEIFAGRQVKGWQEYMKCGYKFAQPPESSWKRLKRTMLVGNAIDAF